MTKQNRKNEKKVRITNGDVLNKIEYIKKFSPKYKTFNTIINRALEYGAPLLYDECFVTGKPIEPDPIPEEQTVNTSDEAVLAALDDLMQKKDTETQIDLSVRLLVKIEILLQKMQNMNFLNNRMLCSLFTEKQQTLLEEPVDGVAFKLGLMAGTPDFLKGQERKNAERLKGTNGK